LERKRVDERRTKHIRYGWLGNEWQ
jgi:hypothetical protein